MGLLIRVCGENEFVHDFEYAFDNLRDGPLKNVHVTWQDIWVCCLLKLLDRETLVFKSDVGSLVLKNIAVVRGWEKRDNGWCLVKAFPVMKLEAFKFGLVSTDNWYQLIGEEEVVGNLGTEDNGATTNFVKGIINVSDILVVDRVRPKDVK